MSTFWRRFLLLLGLIALGGGCNPLMLPFLFPQTVPKEKAEYFKLTSADKKKEVKVAILTSMGLDTRNEFLHADNDLARMMTVQLRKLAADNEETITIINPLKIEEYKRQHPELESMQLDLQAIGKKLKADYVVYIEIGEMSMYQPGTLGTFYRGQANVKVNLIDVKKPEEHDLGAKEILFSYPPEAQGGNKAVDSDTPPQAFKTEFMTALARRLAGLFAERPRIEGHHMDE